LLGGIPGAVGYRTSNGDRNSPNVGMCLENLGEKCVKGARLTSSLSRRFNVEMVKTKRVK